MCASYLALPLQVVLKDLSPPALIIIQAPLCGRILNMNGAVLLRTGEGIARGGAGGADAHARATLRRYKLH
jgi:hypothetical protein